MEDVKDKLSNIFGAKNSSAFLLEIAQALYKDAEGSKIKSQFSLFEGIKR
jgi:hypothetical protein